MQDKIKPAMDLLDEYNHPYDVVYTNFVETIVYDDKFETQRELELKS